VRSPAGLAVELRLGLRLLRPVAATGAAAAAAAGSRLRGPWICVLKLLVPRLLWHLGLT
jgi:hypothetical protein